MIYLNSVYIVFNLLNKFYWILYWKGVMIVYSGNIVNKCYSYFVWKKNKCYGWEFE